MEMNRTSELGSSGKIIHQGDDLRSLELNSEGQLEMGNNFTVSLNFATKRLWLLRFRLVTTPHHWIYKMNRRSPCSRRKTQTCVIRLRNYAKILTPISRLQEGAATVGTVRLDAVHGEATKCAQTAARLRSTWNMSATSWRSSFLSCLFPSRKTRTSSRSSTRCWTSHGRTSTH